MNQLTLHIQGMSCGHCLNAVNAALAAHQGLQIESVLMGRAQLRYDPAVTSPQQIVAAIGQAGYEALPGGSPPEMPSSAAS